MYFEILLLLVEINICKDKQKQTYILIHQADRLCLICILYSFIFLVAFVEAGGGVFQDLELKSSNKLACAIR
jgi:hypothetical protein